MNAFFKSLGISSKSRGERWALWALGCTFAFFALQDLPNALNGTGSYADMSRASREAASQVLETEAIEQCKAAILDANRRAKFGFNNVMTTTTGDVLVELPFTVPVFGLIERDEMTARCALRKNGTFEIQVR